MTKLIILGSSNAIPTQEHETTHLALASPSRSVLIDTGSNPTVRLKQAGLDPLVLTDLLLTHFHPDHVSGAPTLLMNSWLMGRKTPLRIYGLEYTLTRVKKMMALYEWKSWPNFYPVAFNRLPETELHLAIDCPDFRLFTSPVCHLVPAVGLRIESPATHKVIAYSCDTQPCTALINLAAGADILIHEATGAQLGHSSASQAGETARQAGVKALYLIHYSSEGDNSRQINDQAREAFPGPVRLAHDFMEIDLS